LVVVTLSLSLGLNFGCQRPNGDPRADPGGNSTFGDESAQSGDVSPEARYDKGDSSGSGDSSAATSNTGKSPESTTDFDGATSGFGDGKPAGFGNKKPSTNRAPGFDGKTREFGSK
jgi:hypothetical protein